MLKKHSKTDKRHGLGRQAVALAALLTPKTFVLEDIVGLRRNQHDEFKKLGLMLEKGFPCGTRGRIQRSTRYGGSESKSFVLRVF
jgi:hypothetical protein